MISMAVGGMGGWGDGYLRCLKGIRLGFVDMSALSGWADSRSWDYGNGHDELSYTLE